MTILHALTRRAGALVALAVAASTTAGVAATQASAAAAERSAASGVSWHRLTLVHGWHKLSATAPAEYAIKGGVVYLGGAISGGSLGVDFATLPAAARPRHALWIDASTDNNTVGFVKILPTGLMFAGDGTGDATAFTSLAGVSFPARSMPSHPLTLLNGWKSSQPIYNSGNPAYSVSNGIVYLSGSLHGGTSHEFAVLPKGARPKYELFLSVYTSGGTQSQLFIAPNGQLVADGSIARSFESLAGVSFPLPSVPARRLTTLNGWKLAQGFTDVPSYAVRNGIVYLEGTLAQPSPGSIVCARLPAGVRPAHFVYTQTHDGFSTTGALQIARTGYISCLNTVQSDATLETAIWGISFPVNS